MKPSAALAQDKLARLHRVMSRPITRRYLLTLRMRLGHIMEPCAEWPIRMALTERGLLLGPPQPLRQGHGRSRMAYGGFTNLVTT